MKIEMVKRQNIFELEEQFKKDYGVELIVTERADTNLHRFYCRFEHSEIAERPGFLSGIYGDADTIEGAIKDYCKKISNKTMVLFAMSDDKRQKIDLGIINFD